MTLVGKQFSVLERETSKETQISERSDEDKKNIAFFTNVGNSSISLYIVVWSSH